MKRNVKIIVGIVVLVVAGVAYYGLSPLWRTVTLKEAPPVSAVTAIASRPIIATESHPASGSVSVLKTDTETFLRYENFKTINGPDLKVYLATDLEAATFIDLGRLKATDGNVTYTIPPGTDLTEYHYALVWCEQFGVLFNSANLQQ